MSKKKWQGEQPGDALGILYVLRLYIAGASRLFFLLIVLPQARVGLTSRPTSTRSSFDRSPMIFLIGSGNFRTSVGTARI